MICKHDSGFDKMKEKKKLTTNVRNVAVNRLSTTGFFLPVPTKLGINNLTEFNFIVFFFHLYWTRLF